MSSEDSPYFSQFRNGHVLEHVRGAVSESMGGGFPEQRDRFDFTAHLAGVLNTLINVPDSGLSGIGDLNSRYYLPSAESDSEEYVRAWAPKVMGARMLFAVRVRVDHIYESGQVVVDRQEVAVFGQYGRAFRYQRMRQEALSEIDEIHSESVREELGLPLDSGSLLSENELGDFLGSSFNERSFSKPVPAIDERQHRIQITRDLLPALEALRMSDLVRVS